MKRARQENFSSNEKHILFEIIDNYKDIVECKKTDALCTKKKGDTWDKIALDYSHAKPLPVRTAVQLKNFWNNCKREAKKEVAMNRRETFKTGGGEPPKPLTDLTSKITNIISNQINPLEFNFDSDSNVTSYMALLKDSTGSTGILQDSTLPAGGTTRPINTVTTDASSSLPSHNSQNNISSCSYDSSNVTPSHAKRFNSSAPKRSQLSQSNSMQFLRDNTDEYHAIRIKCLNQEFEFAREEHQLKMENLRLENRFLKAKLEQLEDSDKEYDTTN